MSRIHGIERFAVQPSVLAQLRRALRVVSSSNISRMAAALSYRTVFGLIPMLAIGVAVLGGFAGDEQIKETITDVLDLTGLSKIKLSEESTSGPPIVGPTSPEQLAQSAELDQWLQGLVAKVRRVSFVAIGLTGVLVLVYAALSFMVEIERSANHIYRAPTGRSWVRRVTQYWTTLTLGSIFLVGTFYVGESITGTLTQWTSRGDQASLVDQPGVGADTDGRPAPGAADPAGPPAEGAETADAGAPSPGLPDEGAGAKAGDKSIGALAAGMSVSLLIDFILLFFIYTTVPNARVNMRCAAIGAALAAVTWESGKWGFKFVVLNSSAQTLYGAIALVPLSLLWIYITWIIVLSGLQISYVLQHFRTFAVADDEHRGPMLVDPLMLVRVAVEVARRFAAGQTVAVSEVARAIGLDEQTSLAMLERLSDARVLNRVPVGQEREVFALARPAEEIGATELLELAGRMAESGRPENESARLGRLRRAQLDAAAGTSLADLMGGAPGIEPASRVDPAVEPSAEPSDEPAVGPDAPAVDSGEAPGG